MHYKAITADRSHPVKPPCAATALLDRDAPNMEKVLRLGNGQHWPTPPNNEYHGSESVLVQTCSMIAQERLLTS